MPFEEDVVSSGELCGDSVWMMVWEETNGGRRLVRPKDVGSNRRRQCRWKLVIRRRVLEGFRR